MNLKKGPKSINTFFQRIKEIRNKLGVVVVCVDEEELIHLALEALPSEYDVFCLAIRTRNYVLNLEELNTLLNAKERSIKKMSDLRDTSSFAMTVIQFNQSFNIGRGKNGKIVVVVVMEEATTMANFLVVIPLNFLVIIPNLLANLTMVKGNFPFHSLNPNPIINKANDLSVRSVGRMVTLPWIVTIG